MNRISLSAVCAVSIFALFAGQAAAQVTVIQTPPSNAAPVAQQPPENPEDTPEEIAQDAARDLRDSSFYNKPGATRAQYDADWQTCRLIARGSRTPGGTTIYAYDPAVISPLAAGIGAGIGSAIGAAIVEGQLRRANRRACLMYKGWRRVDVSSAKAAEVAKMTDAQRDAYFDSIVGAEQPEGKITALTTFSLAPDPALKLDPQAPMAATLATAKKTDDPKAPIVLGEGEGALVLAFSRPDAGSAGRSAQLHLYRYDMEKHDLMYQPRDWKKISDKTTYSSIVLSKDRKAPYEIHVLKLTAGSYVIGGAMAGPGQLMSTNCFGAPIVTVPAGKAVYMGDLIPFMGVTLSSGEKLFAAMGWAPHLEPAREGLAAYQPALAAGMEEAELRNGATYACAAVSMTKWELPSVPQLEQAQVSVAVPSPSFETASAPATAPADPADAPAN